MSALFLEDFSIGDTFESRQICITVDDIKRFAEQFDPQYFHLDEIKAKDSYFEGLAASGWHVGSVTMRLLTETLNIGSGVIGGGVNIKWLSATRPDDWLSIVVEIKNVEPSNSKPDRGKVTIFVTTLNQNNEIRQTFESTLLVFKRHL